MTLYHRTLLFIRVCWELLRCELVLSVGGFPGLYKGLNRKIRTTGHPGRREVWESALCQAVDIVSACYWKRILCLERSVITARVMHSYGISAEVVIGYAFAPFFSHAWVEVDGRVVNDSTGYPAKLQVLERIRPEAATEPCFLQT